MDEENDTPEELTPHPDQILEEAKSIIEGANAQNTMGALIDAFKPMILAVIMMRNLMVNNGVSAEAADDMIRETWTRWMNHV